MIAKRMRRWGQWTRQCVGLLTLTVAASGVAVAQDQGQPEPSSIDLLTRAVNGELTDIAGSLRQLDQSYVYRGMQGCGSATAGSVNIDWDAKGVPAEKRFRVLPPQPLVLSRSMKQPCQQPRQIIEEVPSTTTPEPIRQPACPCQSSAPAQSAPAPASDCPRCSGQVIEQGVVVDPPLPTVDCPVCPPSVVTEAASSHGCATDRCQSQPTVVTGGYGGKAPPNAMYVNGQWTERPTHWGRENYPYVAPGVRVAPSVHHAPGYSPVW